KRDRARALFAMAAIAATPLLLVLFTGRAASATAHVKLLLGNPYYSGAALVETVFANARLLVGTILNGEVYSAEFLPSGGAPLAACGARRDLRGRAAFVLPIALAMFAPCFYVTFLWNRLRYLWPFATGWIIGLACLARVAGEVCALVRPRWSIVTTLSCGVF